MAAAEVTHYYPGFCSDALFMCRGFLRASNTKQPAAPEMLPRSRESEGNSRSGGWWGGRLNNLTSAAGGWWRVGGGSLKAPQAQPARRDTVNSFYRPPESSLPCVSLNETADRCAAPRCSDGFKLNLASSKAFRGHFYKHPRNREETTSQQNVYQH